MRYMGRRLDTIEKKLIPNKELEILPPRITMQCGRRPTAEDELELGPTKTWITYRQQLQAQEEANVEYLKDHPGSLGHMIRIELDVDEEHRARQCDGSK